MKNNMQSKINAAALLFIWKHGPCTIDDPILNTKKGPALIEAGLVTSELNGYIITPKGEEAVLQILDELDKKECYINFKIKIP